MYRRFSLQRNFSLQYERSRRKYNRAYLNFNYCSEAFNEMLPELKELLKNNSSEFRKFVNSIFDNLSSKINRIDVNTFKTKKDRNQKDISFFSNIFLDKSKFFYEIE